MLEKGVDFIRNVAYIGKCAVERGFGHSKRENQDNTIV
jgi:hypothetical protein